MRAHGFFLWYGPREQGTQTTHVYIHNYKLLGWSFVGLVVKMKLIIFMVWVNGWLVVKIRFGFRLKILIWCFLSLTIWLLIMLLLFIREYELNLMSFFNVNWKVVSFIFKLILAIWEGFLMYILAVKLVRLLLLIWGCEIDSRN
jgi:hypothetical protein